MRSVILGKTGLDVSAVGFGGIPIMRLTTEDAVRVIRHALDLGVTFIDTAAGYGDSQQKIGLALEGRPERVVLATKSPAKSRDGILADVERARREMRVDSIDLFQLHNTHDEKGWQAVQANDGALAGLREAKEKGWIKHIGVTSHSLDMALTMIEAGVFETIQFPFNLVTSEPADRLIPRVRELGMGFIVMKPLCGGEYCNAEFAFKFLNRFPDLVPIPGIETADEIEEVVRLVESGVTFEGSERQEAEQIAASLGKLFCRRCGYCQPCPQGVPIQTGMIFDSMVKRLSPDSVAAGPGKSLAAKADACTECGACEEKCPYDLPIIERLKGASAKAVAICQ